MVWEYKGSWVPNFFKFSWNSGFFEYMLIFWNESIFNMESNDPDILIFLKIDWLGQWVKHDTLSNIRFLIFFFEIFKLWA